MRKYLFIFYTTICLSSVAQEFESVNLQWKLGNDEMLVYKTVMSEIDTSSLEFNFGSIFDTLDDSIPSETKMKMKQLEEAFRNIDLLTTLTPDGDAVQVEMKTVDIEENDKKKQKKEDEVDVQKLLSSLNEGVVLRGSVYKTGGIKSFWVKTNQKNVIAIFFQLPQGEIQVGDTWEIDANFIGNDQNFKCDSAYQKNEVSLIDVKLVDGDTVAVIKYDIQEYVQGSFSSPFAEKPTLTTMLMTHEAIAEFSVSKGRWNSYNGIMSYIASGIMSSNTKKRFSLVAIDM